MIYSMKTWRLRATRGRTCGLQLGKILLTVASLINLRNITQFAQFLSVILSLETENPELILRYTVDNWKLEYQSKTHLSQQKSPY